MGLYVVLRPFTGGGVSLSKGDVISDGQFDMPYGRADQLVATRYLAPAPIGAKATIVPDPTQVPQAERPDGDAGFDSVAFADKVRRSQGKEDAAQQKEASEANREPDEVTADEVDEVAAVAVDEQEQDLTEDTPESPKSPAPARKSSKRKV